jgi:hypothetical protein
MNQLVDSLASDPTVGAVGIALLGAVGGLWVAAAWWTYADMSRRSTMELARLTAVGWILISTPALLPLSLATYLLARPQRTVAEQRAQRLFEALAPSIDDGRCRACGERVDPEWQRCPACATWLASACATCGRVSAVELDTCPWCAADKVASPEQIGIAAERVAATSGRVAVGPGRAIAGDRPADAARSEEAEPAPLFVPAEDDETGAWTPAPASGEARPAAAFSAHRIGALNRPGNRGARDPRRVRDAERVAGSDRLGIG